MNVTNSKGQQEFSFGKEIHFGARGVSPQEQEDNGGRFFREKPSSSQAFLFAKTWWLTFIVSILSQTSTSNKPPDRKA